MNPNDLKASDELETTDADAMREKLRKAFAKGAHNNFFRQLMRTFRDPVTPETEHGRWRPHPLFLVGGVLLLAAAAIFLYMTFFD
jgi:hypothetical protein